MEDLPEVAGIHLRAFSDFFLTRLGDEFLDRYYRLVMRFDGGILLVHDAEGLINGFVSGFIDPGGFYRMMWDNRWDFVRPVMGALVRRPSLAADVIHGVQHIQTTASEWPSCSCELSSIAVEPASSRSGVGRALMHAFLVEAAARHARSVYLTTDADNNQHANELYRKTGFQQIRRFLQRKGRWMNEYVIDAESVEGNCESHR
ncbi:MAG TPA: GNAT family N-acetyltransferase [Rariglobus sp.]